MLKAPAASRGRLVAAILAGSWRPVPPSLQLGPAQLDEIGPLLLASGVGALAWRRVRRTELETSSAAAQLHQAYRLYSLQSVVRVREIEQVFELLRAAGVEPLLVKGWAVARLYPEEGLRPGGDIDLCIRPEQYRAARDVLKSAEGRRYNVDLHRGFERLDGASAEELFERSQPVSLGNGQVRILAPEDHLRVLSFHMLREGVWRPIWLCDVAVAVESRGAGFDWERCLSRDRQQSDWVACAIGLAHQLLGVAIDGTPVERRAGRLPSWLVPGVLKQWRAVTMHRRYNAPVRIGLRHPVEVLRGLRYHWPNPIEGTIGVGGSFNELPRLPFQLADCLLRTKRLMTRLPDRG